jgi:Lar family restriction alleviation protein
MRSPPPKQGSKLVIELKPCPFCGNAEPYFERTGTPRQSCIVECGNCGCRHESSDEGDNSGLSWNERTPATPPAPTTEPTAKPITGLTGEMVMSAHALCPTDMSHPKRMAWMAKVLTRALAEKNGLAVQGDGT